MNIVKQKWEFLNLLVPHVPPQAQKLFRFGCSTLVFREVRSFRSNARLFSCDWYAAKMKMYRLTINKKMHGIFISLVTVLSIVPRDVTLAVDFSDFGNGFQVLMFAVQTRKGRALPIYFEILHYPIEKNSQNTFIIRTIGHLTEILGFAPKLVFDWGFACPALIQFLANNNYIFIVRIKKIKACIDQATGLRFLAGNAPSSDVSVEAYGLALRLVVSEKAVGSTEPWYLITNDVRTSRTNIITEYYHRFEIEEFFRDAKREIGLEYVSVKKAESLAVLLWFTILGMWFAWRLLEQITHAQRKEKVLWGVSYVRYYFEKVYQEIILSAEGVFMNPQAGNIRYEKV